MDTSGSNPIRLTFNNATDRSPRYSPDGARIMFSSQSFFSGSITIWEMNNDGSNPQQLSPVDHIIADWKPDGTEIVSVLWNFTCPVEGNGQLWLMNADGTGLRQLTFYNPHH
jgi:TolB protein